MLEPQLQEFGLRKTSPGEYELIGRMEPQPSDFGLSDNMKISKYPNTLMQIRSPWVSPWNNKEYPRFFTEKKWGYVISTLTLLITLIISIWLMSPNDNSYTANIVQIFYCYLFLIFPLGYIIHTIMMSKFIIGVLDNYEENFLKKYSREYNQYYKYKQSMDKYLSNLYIAMEKYEHAKNAYTAQINLEIKKLQRKELHEIKKLDEQKLWEFRKQKNYWFSLDGRTFESEICQLFKKIGYKAKLTPVTNDHGIDIVLTKGDKKIIVQCKQTAKPAGPHVVRDLYGTLIETKADGALLICTSGFTSGVYNYVQDKNITLMDINDILKMVNSSVWPTET